MKTEDKSKQKEGSAYTSVVTDYKHKCSTCSCKDLHKEPKPSKV